MTGTPGAALQLAMFGFALMAVIAAVCALVIRGIVVLLAKTQRKPLRPSAVLVMPARDDRAMVAAVIGAAVHAFLSGRPHRVIHFAETSPSSQAWTRQVRARHHASHAPRP